MPCNCFLILKDYWLRSGVFIVNFEHISHFFWGFCCWTGMCLLGAHMAKIGIPHSHKNVLYPFHNPFGHETWPMNDKTKFWIRWTHQVHSVVTLIYCKLLHWLIFSCWYCNNSQSEHNITHKEVENNISKIQIYTCRSSGNALRLCSSLAKSSCFSSK